MNQNTKMLVGAVVAAALAIAVYYGLISQQAATNIQNQANQTLGTAPVSQSPAPPTAQPPTAPNPTAPPPAGPPQQNPAPPAPH